MKTCRNCSTQLTGRQRFWCSSRCEKAYELAHFPATVRARGRRYHAAVRGPRLKSLRVPKLYRSDRLDPAVKKARQQARARRWWASIGRSRWVSKATGEREPVVLPMPYHGHQWLDMARDVAPLPPPHMVGTERYEQRLDEQGEALLALLEGKDPRDAVRKYRTKEFVPRHRTVYFGEFRADEEWKLDAILLDETSYVPENPATLPVLMKSRYHGGTGKAQMGSSRQGAPSNRRSNNR